MLFGFKDNAFILPLNTAYDGWEAPVTKLRRQPVKSSTSVKTARLPFQRELTKALEIPEVIDKYNNNINGVDISDQLRAGIQKNNQDKTRWATGTSILFLLEVAVTNTYLQRYSWEKPITTQSAFRQQLYSQIFERFGQKETTSKYDVRSEVFVPFARRKGAIWWQIKHN